MIRRFIFAAVLACSASVHAAIKFEVDVPQHGLPAQAKGRVVVYLVGPDRKLDHTEPADWDYLHDPMPVCAVNATLAAGGHVTLDAHADTFGTALDRLPAGTWHAQAVFDHNSACSGWRMEPGNLSSGDVTFDLKPGADQVVHLSLTHVVAQRDYGDSGAVEVKVRSKLLSDFAGHDVYLYAGISLPISYTPDGRYATVYEIPGFGGDRYGAADESIHRQRLVDQHKRGANDYRLAEAAFHITLDPESPNGHTLCADSDVNGPYGRAIVEELIPEIEREYPCLIREERARLLTGHSSGGFAACWLQTQYPQTFGGAWPSSPDPLDFRSLERIDLYAWDNLYLHDGAEAPSVRDEKGNTTLHVREENAWENVVGGSNNAGGQQWASWQAVFGLPRGDGYPKSLWNITTGAIDRSQLDHYRKYDMSALLRADPAKYAPIWRERIRLLVGGADDYFLNEAVVRLRDELEQLPATGSAKTNKGYFKVVPGKTHDTIYDTPEMHAVSQEMLDQLDEASVETSASIAATRPTTQASARD